MASRIRMTGNRSSVDPMADPRLKSSGFHKCMQCGRCTASCPAAYAFGDYLPRAVMGQLSLGREEALADAVWRCGQCYSCRARCPRNNSVGEAVLALREQFTGGGQVPDYIREVSALLRQNLHSRGETFLPQMLTPALLEEFGPKTYRRCSGNVRKRVALGYEKDDARACRIPDEALAEIRYILKATDCGEIDEQK